MDDFGYNDIGCYTYPSKTNFYPNSGPAPNYPQTDPAIPDPNEARTLTPRLDQMADQGIRFTDYYSCARNCTPARAALVTGCYAPRVDLPTVVIPTTTYGLSTKEITIAEILKTRGYATGLVGKWHLGYNPFVTRPMQLMPRRHGFDEFYGIPTSNGHPPVGNTFGDFVGGLFLWENETPIQTLGTNMADTGQYQHTLTWRYTERALDFIERNQDGPFFLYLAHSMPHTPVWPSLTTFTNADGTTWPQFAGSSGVSYYYDVVKEVDHSMGRIFDKLQALGIDDDTLVIFTSDNGPWLSFSGRVALDDDDFSVGSAYPLRESKNSNYEGGPRVPCIARWPGEIPAGQVTGEVAGHIDLLPTLVKLAGGAPPSDRVIDGKDIWPLLSGQPGAVSPHSEFYYYQDNTINSVRQGKWKFRRINGSTKELYDLDADIQERTNEFANEGTLASALESTMLAFDASLKANERQRGNFSDQEIVIDNTRINFNEGGNGAFRVKLIQNPGGSVTVNAARVFGDSSISVSGGASLNFNSSNWDTCQTVTIAAAPDVDGLDAGAIIRCSSSAFQPVREVFANASASGALGPYVFASFVPSVASGNLGESVTFDATDSYVDELTSPIYTWDFGDGSPTVQGVSVNHTFSTAGAFPVTLTISETGTPDMQGQPERVLDFEVVQPTATAVIAAARPPGSNTVTFSAASSTTNVLDPVYNWNFGDGNTGVGIDIEHTYAASGDYTVELEITRAGGGSVGGSPTASELINAGGSTPLGQILHISHDGTSGDESDPFDTNVLSQGVDWTYGTDGARSIMTGADTATSGNNRLIVVKVDDVPEFNTDGGPAGKGWIFEIELELLQGEGETGGGFAYFGVRSENHTGKQAWIALSETGGAGDSGQIGFVDDANNFVGSPADLDVGSLIGDGEYHNFKLHKYDNGGTTTVDVFMDDDLVLSRSYSSLPDDLSGKVDVQGFASSTPTPRSEVNIDFINFTLFDNLVESSPLEETVPTASTVAYWEFDDGDLTGAAVGGATFTLTNNGYVGTTSNLVQPIPNPDASSGFVGDATNNAGSVSDDGGGSEYFVAGANSRNALLLDGNAWTFEGWLRLPANVSFDPIFSTRGGPAGDGIMFDVRTVESQTVFNLFLDARGGTGGGSNSGSNSGPATEFRAVAVPLATPFHFAVTHDGAGGFELFVDGVSRATHTTSLNLGHIDSGDTTQLELLGRAGDGDGAFGGSADEFRITNKVLMSSEFLSAVLGPANDFNTWIASGSFGLDPGDQGFAADPDFDGVPSGVEAFFGTDPSVFTSGLTGLSKSGAVVTFRHANPDTPLDDVSGSYEWSPDLSSWYSADGVDGDGSTTVNANATANTPSPNVTTVEATIGGAEPSRIFLRAKAILD